MFFLSIPVHHSGGCEFSEFIKTLHESGSAFDRPRIKK